MELAQLLQGYGYDVQPGQAVSYGATPDLVGLSNSQVIHTRGVANHHTLWNPV